MKTLRDSMILILAAVILAAGIQPVSAAKEDVLYGTTGRCNNEFPGGPCTQTSDLWQIDPSTGAGIRKIGPVGYTVNGLAWDHKSQTLYASTAIGDVSFHGLITIDTTTGAGTPVNPAAENFGLSGDDSPIHSITIDSAGRMVGWYDEFGNGPDGGNIDTFVKIDKTTGIATEFPDTGIDTFQNGLSFDQGNNQLWNISGPRIIKQGDPVTQTAYHIDPSSGKSLGSIALNPPTMAALGDFNPANKLYYGLKFRSFDPDETTFIVVVDVRNGKVAILGKTVNRLHTLAFAKNVKK